MANVTYNRTIRKLIVGFGNLFDSITLVRYSPIDNSEDERFVVPLEYATKEDYVMRLQGDADLDKKVQITLPRMSFDMQGISYDASRKQQTVIKSFVQTPTGIISQYMPVPYNFDFNLYIYVRNIEDGLQLIEHITPYFTPDYTIKLDLITEMGITKEVPIVLNTLNYEVNYEGNRDSDTRMIVWTLNFTVKGYIYGAISDTGLIKNSITNILNNIDPATVVTFNMSQSGVGNYNIGEIVYQGYSSQTATASAKVLDYANTANSYLTVTNISGNFISSQPIHGVVSGANHNFTSSQFASLEMVKISITPNPSDATSNSTYTYTTTITETANT